MCWRGRWGEGRGWEENMLDCGPKTKMRRNRAADLESCSPTDGEVRSECHPNCSHVFSVVSAISVFVWMLNLPCLTDTHTQAEENRRNRKKLTSIFLRLRFIIYGERLNWKSEIYVEKWFNKKNILNPALGITPLEVICLIGAVIWDFLDHSFLMHSDNYLLSYTCGQSKRPGIENILILVRYA